jgi:hypothetical protein
MWLTFSKYYWVDGIVFGVVFKSKSLNRVNKLVIIVKS